MDLGPEVSPPPTPTKTGTLATSRIAWVIDSCGVNGYTAIIELALLFFMMATSVENRRDLILVPRIFIPLALYITSGTTTDLLLSCDFISGTYFSFSMGHLHLKWVI